jgi:hypothetical protein
MVAGEMSDSDVFAEPKLRWKRKKADTDDPNVNQDVKASPKRARRTRDQATLASTLKYCAEQKKAGLGPVDPEWAEQFRQAELQRAARQAAAEAKGIKPKRRKKMTMKERRLQMKVDLEAGLWNKWGHEHVLKTWIYAVRRAC